MENMTSPGTLLSGDNATWLEEYYQTWLRTPEKLPEDWRRFFLSPELTVQSVSGDNNVSGATLKKQAAVIQLINAWRTQGHLRAKLDPLGLNPPADVPSLQPGFWGLSEEDLLQEFSVTFGAHTTQMPLKQLLNTFNEVNMQSVMDLRARWKDRFAEKHGVKLGFMSFFVKAVTRALERFPVVNASVDGNEIIWRDYCDIGIAVSSNRGLVVPVLRNAQSLSLVEIERQIAEYATQARNGKLPLEALQGGTFSITNGGTFGSMMSTPIINPPQSAILGMHAITPRPVAENGQVVIRPMMYLALSYGHRIIDGQEAVQTLVAIRELLESPEQLLLDL